MSDEAKSLVESLRALASLPLYRNSVARMAMLQAASLIERLEKDVQRYQEKADAIHRYLGDKDNASILAVITELSLDAQSRVALAEKESHET